MTAAETDTRSTVLITGAGSPLGVNLTRSLRRIAGLTLVGTETNRWHLPLSLCDRTYRIPAAGERDAFAAALAEVIERERVGVVLPTHALEVRAVAELRDQGALAACGTALPRSDVLMTADDKAITQLRLESAGVPVPETVVLRGPEEIAAAFERFGGDGRPVWVRGSGTPGIGIGGAALPCRDPQVAKAWVDHCRGWGNMAASEYLPGANLTWMAAFDRGRLLAAAGRERLEYVIPHVAPSGVTGAPAVSRTIAREDLADVGERAIRAIDAMPHGAYFVDLKEDADGNPRVTEINAGRCGTTVQFYTEAGCNFPWLLVRLARGERPEPLPNPYQAVEPDLYWVRTLDCGPELVRGDDGFDRFPCVAGAPAVAEADTGEGQGLTRARAPAVADADTGEGQGR